MITWLGDQIQDVFKRWHGRWSLNRLSLPGLSSRASHGDVGFGAAENSLIR